MLRVERGENVSTDDCRARRSTMVLFLWFRKPASALEEASSKNQLQFALLAGCRFAFPCSCIGAQCLPLDIASRKSAVFRRGLRPRLLLLRRRDCRFRLRRLA